MTATVSMTELELAMRKLAQQVKLDTINACAQAAMDAYSQTTADKYVLEGPAGMASRMIGAVRALAFAPESRP
jgi:hypothetical protein